MYVRRNQCNMHACFALKHNFAFMKISVSFKKIKKIVEMD